MSHRLSKSKFQAGVQCHKLLWWHVHEPDAEELTPSSEQQRRFDLGTEVGERARQHVPGGVLIEWSKGGIGANLDATRDAVAQGVAVIYEASFSAGGVFAAVDILERDGDGWRIIEVKSSLKVKDVHISDVAVQMFVLEQAGLEVTGADVMVLNRECAYPDLDDLFVRHDVTEAARAFAVGVPEAVQAQMAMLAESIPDVAIGDHCSDPYRCPFHDRCWPELPEHHVSTLYRGRNKVEKLEAAGCKTIGDIPPDFRLNATQARQRRAVVQSQLVCEPELSDVLNRLPRTLGYLDFETVAPAIPCWNGCHPYDAVPAQFVYYERDGQGNLRSDEWLADAQGDPRAALAQHLVDVCRNAGIVLAWYAHFEKRVIDRLADALPELADDLHELNSRIVDLLPIVRNHVYHPDFQGSFSLKRVLPALVPALSYKDLEIQSGSLASAILEQLVISPKGVDDDERTRLRAALQAYCQRDTLGMVRLHERLLELAAGGSNP
jgi:predicted RecB family nuclease